MSRRAKLSRARKNCLQRRRLLVESLERRDLLATYTTPEDTPLTVDDAVLDDAVVQVAPAHGTLSLAEDGGFIYSPAPNYNGPDSFIYRPEDGTAADDTTVSLNITPVNDFPDIYPRLIGAVQGQRISAEAAWGLLPSQYDFEGDRLDVHLVSGPEHGTLALNSDGSYSYQSDPDFWGVDHFVYRVSDGHTAADVGITTATVSVESANDLPQAYDDYYNVAQDEVLHADNPSVIRNNGTLAPGVTTTVVNGPAHGILVLAPNGKFTYTPDAGFNGVVQFTYRINDPAASTYPQVPSDATENDKAAYRSILPRTLGTVTIQVGTIIGSARATGDSYAVQENGELSVGGPGLLANDSPAYRQQSTPVPQLTAVIQEAPSHGTVTVNADGSFTYRPNPGFVGLDEFRYRAIDPGTNDLPNQYGPYYDPAVGTVRIYVTPVAPPLAVGDDYNVVQDQPLETSGPYSVLTNDVGAGRPLTATLVTGPAHGTVTLHPDGTFTYTPAPGFFGIDSFTYRASDGTPPSPSVNDLPGFSNIAAVTLYVSATGPEIVARDDVYATAEDTKLVVTIDPVLSNDHRPEFRKLEPLSCIQAITHGFYQYYYPTHVVLLVEGPRHGTLTLKEDGTFEYTPNAGFTGSDTFTYRVRSEIRYPGLIKEVGMSEVATATIQVNPRNHAPTATNDIYRVLAGEPITVAPGSGVMANDSPSSGANRVVLVSGPIRGTLTLNPDGSFTYSPGPGVYYGDVFSYRLRDDAAGSGGPYFSNIAYVSLDGFANDLAIGALDDRYTATKDTPLNIGPEGVLENDFQLPRLDSGNFHSSGQFIAFTGCGLYGPSIRTDDPPLTVAVVSGPQHGSLTLRPDGSFDYTPEPGFTGIDTFTYQANGPPRFPQILSLTGPNGTITYPQPVEPVPHAVATAVIIIRDPSQQPIFLLQDGHESTDESGSQRVAGWAALTIEGASGSLAPGQRFELTTDRPELFAQLPAIDSAGQLLYTPAPNVTGTAIVTVKLVGDEGNLSAARSFTINITKPHAFHNTAKPLDVSNDNFVVANDALLIIDYLNQQHPPAGDEGFEAANYYDVNGDGHTTPDDALLVIDYLNGQSVSGEGESRAESGPADVLSLLALDSAAQAQRRKRT